MRLVCLVVLVPGLCPGCQGSGQEDPCRNVACHQPPGSACRDESTLLEYSPEGVCDPQTGQCTYESMERPCEHGCQSGSCNPDPDAEFAILSPPGASLCTTQHHLDVFQELQTKGILTFREGTFRLPRDRETFELEWIDRVEISPGRILGPLGPGTFNLTVVGDPQEQASYDYLYRQDYDLDGQVFELTVRASFLVTAGVCENPVLTVDDARFLVENCSPSTPANGESLSWQSGFTTCQFGNQELFTPTRVEVDMQNGDRVHFHQRLSYHCAFLPTGDWAELVTTEFFRGEQQAVVTDFFLQAFSAEHHVFGQSMLAVLDPALEEVHGLLIRDADRPEHSLEYLDADLQPLPTPAISDVRIVSGP